MVKPISPIETTSHLAKILSQTKILPVVTINDIDDAVPVAEALLEGGLNVIEITLRTKVAMEAIRRISSIKQVTVGAGTLINAEDTVLALRAGAKFAVSPGSTAQLIHKCEEVGLPLLGGVASASEAIRMLNRGYKVMKFFPAEALGGVNALRAIQGPLPQISFCPTGGISAQNSMEYLKLPNVICVGGSWMVTQEMIETKDWAQITKVSLEASKLG